MIAAGRLLASKSVHSEIDSGIRDEFADWLSRHDISRRDHRWLWDRRDPKLDERAAWRSRIAGAADRHSITRDDFAEAVVHADTYSLWGHWTEADSSRQQSVSIQSALVNPETADALLRAVTGGSDPYDHMLPEAGGEREIDRPGFRLKGWLIDRSGDRGLDERDRWAGGINFPPPRPAPFVVDQMSLTADLDQRYWSNAAGAVVVETRVWGEYDETKRHETTDPNRGERLRASKAFVVDLLEKLGSELIVKITIERRRRYSSYERSEKDDERIPTTAKFYLVAKDGSLRSL